MGYKGPNPNEISEDVPERARIVLFVVRVSDPKDETVTHGSLYNFVVLNSPVTGHLWKMIKSQLVKPILMKHMVLEQGHVRLPQCKVLDIEE